MQNDVALLLMTYVCACPCSTSPKFHSNSGTSHRTIYDNQVQGLVEMSRWDVNPCAAPWFEHGEKE